MGFVSFVGRVLFASIFLLSAYQEYVFHLPFQISFPVSRLTCLERGCIAWSVRTEGSVRTSEIGPARRLRPWISLEVVDLGVRRSVGRRCPALLGPATGRRDCRDATPKYNAALTLGRGKQRC
jgi:hypothetical protein